MPYVNELHRLCDIWALTLGLKDNVNWISSDDKTNYPLLLSIYIETLKQDHDNFFIETTKKEKFIQSLERSKQFYTFEHGEELSNVLQTMRDDDPTDFMLLPIHYLLKKPKIDLNMGVIDGFRASGLLIYKAPTGYKAVIVDKMRPIDGLPVSYVLIPPKNLSSLCEKLLLNNQVKKYTKAELPTVKKREILETIIDHSISKKLLPLNVYTGYQKVANDTTLAIKAPIKTALFHCQYDIFKLRDPYYEKITWKNVSSNPETNSNPTITARKSLLATIKKFSGVSNCFDHLFSWYLTKKQRKVNYDYTVDFNKDPFINQIFTGEINNKSYFYQKKQQCITASKHIQKSTVFRKIEIKNANPVR